MSVSLDKYYGKTIRPTFDTDPLQLHDRVAKVWMLDPATAGLNVRLPDATRVLHVGWIFQLINDSGDNSFGVEDNDGNALATIEPGETAFVALVDQSTTAGSWVLSTGQFSSGPGESDFVSFSASVKVRLNIEATLTVDDDAANFQDFSGALTIFSDIAATLTVEEGNPTTNIVSPTATGGGDGTTGNPYTLKEVAELDETGTFWLKGGTYPDSSTHTVDTGAQAVIGGTSKTARKIFRAFPGETPVITRKWRMDGISHIETRGIDFESGEGKTMLLFRNGADDLVVDQCQFNSDTGAGVAGSFSGIHFRSATNILVQRCKFLDWWGTSSNNGDMFQIDDCSKVTILGNDFTACRSGHSIFNYVDSNNDIVIAANLFKNPWTRVIQTKTSLIVADPDSRKGYLCEGNVFFESNDPASGFPQSTQSSHTARMSEYRTIVRNNVFFANKDGPGGGKGEWESEIFDDGSFVTFKAKVYHNTIKDGIAGGYGLVQSTSVQQITEALSVVNNVTDVTLGTDEYLILIDIVGEQTDSIEWETFHYHHNLLHDQGGRTDIVLIEPFDNQPRSLSQIESDFPAIFHDNTVSAPTYSDGTKPADVTIRADWFTSMALAGGSAGENAGDALSETTQSGSSTSTVPVKDAAVFWGGGGFQGEYLGDLVVIGGVDVRVIGVDLGQQTITVDSSISFISGAKIYLKEMGSATPNMGIWGAALANGMQVPS